MNRLDLIIDALDVSESLFYDQTKLQEALQAARELKTLKPVGYMDSRGVLFNNTTHPQLNTALYALDEVKHD
jgi:hypothetical protein